MYERFFGLRERPFELTPNPKYLYLTGKHREALSNLQYGISGRKGITVLIGDAGTGKTTIVRAAIDALAGPGVRCVYVSNPVLTRAEFYEFLAPRFGLSGRAATSKAQFLSELEDDLLAQHKAGGTTALIVDEAQSLPHELMEEVRLLANFETADEKLLQVVLAGQPELAERLEREGLRQLKQRVALRCELLPLDLRETASYISGRIHIAGGEAVRIFTREAIQTIHHHSLGIPRTISVICDNAMVTAFAAGTMPIGSGVILDVCRDFNLLAPDDPVAPPVAGRTDSGAVVRTDQAGAKVGEPGNGRHPARNVVMPKPGREATQPVVRPRLSLDVARLPATSTEKRPAVTLEASRRDAASTVAESSPATTPAKGKPGVDTLFGLFTKKKRFRFF